MLLLNRCSDSRQQMDGQHLCRGLQAEYVLSRSMSLARPNDPPEQVHVAGIQQLL